MPNLWKTCAMLTALLASPLPATAEVVTWKTVAGWDVSFYPSMNGCLAFASFEGGFDFFVGLTNLGGEVYLDLSIFNPEWQAIEEGKEYSVNVVFGDETPWTLEMAAVRSETLSGLTFSAVADTDSSGLLVEEFSREISMDWQFEGRDLAYVTLSGSRAAFDEVLTCAQSYREAIRGSDPFAAGQPTTSTDPFAP